MPGLQPGGTFLAQLFATVTMFANVGLALDAKDQRYLARDILQNATAVDDTVLTSRDCCRIRSGCETGGKGSVGHVGASGEGHRQGTVR